MYNYSDYNAIGKINHIINLSEITNDNILKIIDSYLSVIRNAGDNENNVVEENNLIYIKVKTKYFISCQIKS